MKLDPYTLEVAAMVCEELEYPTALDEWMRMAKKEHTANACRQCAKAILALSPTPTPTELVDGMRHLSEAEQKVMDRALMASVKIIDNGYVRVPRDQYVLLGLIEAATRLHEAARPEDGPDQDALIPARVFREFVDAHAAALRFMSKRAGWVLVPPEPTEEMLQAALDSYDDGKAAPAYRAMIQAAPGDKGE